MSTSRQSPTQVEARHIDVEVQISADEWAFAGTIILPEANKAGGFYYDDDYMRRKLPPLSPDLDYRTQGAFHVVEAPSSQLRGHAVRDLHPAFAQALPGEWGTLVMTSHDRTYARKTPGERLWSLANHQCGALRFVSGGGDDYGPFIDSSNALRALQSRVNEFIHRYAQTREIPFKLGTEREKWALIVNGGRSPKAAYRDDDGREYVAKFPREIVGAYEEARVEAALLEVSAQGGIPTANTTLVDHGDGWTVLLSERFDRRADGSYVHAVPADVGLGVPLGARADYAEVADWLWKHSSQPKADVEALFGRMLLNLAVNNTDDHLGQMQLLQEGDKWRLAPNIDVLVTELSADGSRGWRNMTMAGHDAPHLSAGWVDMAATAFGLSQEQGQQIALKVLAAVEDFVPIARRNGVSEATLQELLIPAIDYAGIERTLSVLREQQAKREATMKSLGM